MSTKSWREIKHKIDKRKGDDVKKETQTDRDPEEYGGGEGPAEKPPTVRPLLYVRVVYANGETDEFEQVDNILQHETETSWLLTGPGPNIIIPGVNVRYLQVWEMGE